MIIRISFGSKLEYVSNKNISPGPGNYNSPKSVTNIGTKFGSEKRDDIYTYKKNTLIPGPGKYNSNSYIGESSKFKFSISKKENIVNDLNPGPGTYNIKERCGKEGVKNSLSGRPKSSPKGILLVPGPGAYNPEQKEFIPSYRLCSELKKSASNILNVPGPGQYKIEEKLNFVNKKSPTWKYIL